MSEAEQKRPRRIPLAKELDRPAGEDVGQVRLRGGVRQIRNIEAVRLVPLPRPAEGSVVRRRLASPIDAPRPFEPMMLREVGIRLPEVPLAEVGGLITARLERLPERLFGSRERDLRRGMNPVRDPQSLRDLAGHQRGPRRRTDRMGRVEVGEPDPRAGQRVDVRRLMKGRTIYRDVPAPQVIDQKDEDIRPDRLLIGRGPPHRDEQSTDGDEHSEAKDSRRHGLLPWESGRGWGPTRRPLTRSAARSPCRRTGSAA